MDAEHPAKLSVRPLLGPNRRVDRHAVRVQEKQEAALDQGQRSLAGGQVQAPGRSMFILGRLFLLCEPGLLRNDLGRFIHLVCRLDRLRQCSPTLAIFRHQGEFLQALQGSLDGAGPLQASERGNTLRRYAFFIASFPPKKRVDDPGMKTKWAVPGLSEHSHALFGKETLAKWVWQHQIHREQKAEVKRTKNRWSWQKADAK